MRESALTILIERHQAESTILFILKFKTGICQMTFFKIRLLKLLKPLKTKSYNEEGKFLPWVMRIAHNLVVDHFRKK